MKKLITLMATALLAWPATQAQIVTTSPAILQTNSTGIVITYHADEGNKALAGVTSSTKVYAHTGVITSASTSNSDWKHDPTWGTNTAKYELTWVSDNTWTLNIGDIDTYYGLTSDETVKKLAFVFRTADNSLEGKTASGGDILVDVYPAGEFAMTLDGPSGVLTSPEPQKFTVNTTEAANISISVNGTKIASAASKTQLVANYTFVGNGAYTVEASATAGSVTKTASLEVNMTGASSAADYPGGVPKMGPVVNNDGSVTFCLAAPNKTTVILRGSWNDYAVNSSSVMNYQDKDGIRYFWTTVYNLDLTQNHIYFFNIDGKKDVGDPYARLVLDPSYDSSISSTVFPNRPAYPSAYVSSTPVAWFNPAMFDYQWQATDFVRPGEDNLMIYELLLRDFTGTEGLSRGNGTVAMAMEKLDYLQQLGVNAVELLPIMEFNGNNSWGYNTNFYFAPDKAYGTPQDYKKFIDECHARGMAVILDIVFNQSDGRHPWYMMYNMTENPFYNGTAPHGYSVLNDWNQDYPLVQQQWKDALKYWLTEFNVDGFRFDLVKGLGNNDSYGATYQPATNTWTNVTDAKTNAYNATRVARMKELHDAMREVSPTAYFINENLATAREENEMAADGELNWANVNNSSCQFAMGYNSDASLARFYAPYDGSRTWGSTVSYAESHDEERMAYKQTQWGASGVKGNTQMSMRRLGSVAAQMIMTPGAHMIWQFQEFGADQTTKTTSGSNNTNPKKVIWSYLDDPYHAGLHDEYEQLLNIRLNEPEMFTEDVTISVMLTQWGSGRTISLVKGQKAIYVVVNPEVSATKTISTPVDLSSSDYEVISRSCATEPQASAAGVTLAPGAFAVYGTKGMYNGVSDIASDTEALPLIYGVEGAIIVEGDYANVQAYTVAGQPVGLSGLQPGIYIVRADSRAAKVRVY